MLTCVLILKKLSLGRRGLIGLLLAAGLSLALPVSLAHSQTLPGRELVLEDQKGNLHSFQVEVAATPAARANGLMYRRELAPQRGMLFDFLAAQTIAMWMKNTLLPLDMLFVTEDGRVVTIAERAVPGSLTPIPSEVPVRYVIELNGGTVSRLRLKTGDRVIRGLAP